MILPNNLKVISLTLLISIVICDPSLKEQEADEYLQEMLPKIEERYKMAYEFSFKLDEGDDPLLGEQLYNLLMGVKYEKFFDDLQTQLKSYDYENFESEQLKRHFKLLIKYDYKNLDEDDAERFAEIITAYKERATTLTICDFSGTDCEYTHDEWRKSIIDMTDIDEIRHYWKAWRRKAGSTFKSDFEEFVKLYQNSFSKYGFDNASVMWYHDYLDNEISNDIDDVIANLQPFYSKLHAYVRNFLQSIFGDDIVPSSQPISDELLEKYIYEALKPDGDLAYPFQDKPILNLRDEFEDKNYTPLKFIEVAAKFLQLDNLPRSFWKDRIQVQDEGPRCVPESISYHTRDDIGFKFCNETTLRNFLATHREVARIKYHMNTQDLPLPDRHIIWPGFTEAVAYSVLVSAASPSYLTKLGFLEYYDVDNQTTINRLYRVAVQTVFKMHTNFIQDKFRLEALMGNINASGYNCYFWNLQDAYLGTMPPFHRTNMNFDALSTLKKPLDKMRTNQIFAKVVGFQLFEHFCNLTQHVGPLANCDFSDSEAAIGELNKLMSYGATKHWRDILEEFLGTRLIDVSAMLRYFEPLYNWLQTENEKNEVTLGWTGGKSCD